MISINQERTVNYFNIAIQLKSECFRCQQKYLLGITLGILIDVNPMLVLIPFAIGFALFVIQLVESSSLATDALLNIVYSNSLAAAILALSRMDTYSGGIKQLLFGDVLEITNLDLIIIGILLLARFVDLSISI